MRTPAPIPDELLARPFHRREALALGITPRQLQHPRFVGLFPAVYRHESTTMTPTRWIQAGELTLPDDARVSHQTRFVGLGLEYGPLFPLHFTIGRDHHLAAVPEGLTLHRTVRMPRHSENGVSPASALILSASIMRLIDVVKIGDWLLHRGHLDLHALERSVQLEPWRPGAEIVERALPLMSGRSRSLPESELRCLLEAAGLPRPEANVDLFDDEGTFLGCGDLVYRDLKLVVEHEGRQHAFDVTQFERDIHRYGGFRRNDLAYVQTTGRMLDSPRTTVLSIHDAMVSRGYAGPAPTFGPTWAALFAPPQRLTHHRRVVDSQR